jgi:hypothetical protein
MSQFPVSNLRWVFDWSGWADLNWLKAAVVRMREKGLKATGCTFASRAIDTCLLAFVSYVFFFQ